MAKYKSIHQYLDNELPNLFLMNLGMANYKSLYQYLDNELPSLFIMNLRNSFSFLPFVKPVDPNLFKLRQLVNKAKTNSASYEYLTYLLNTSNRFFGIFLQEMSCTFSKKEEELLTTMFETSFAKVQKIIPKQTSSENNEDSQSDQVSSQLLLSFKKPEVKNYLKDVLALLNQENWLEQFSQLLIGLNEEEKSLITKQLIFEALKNRNEQIITCALFALDNLGFDNSAIQQHFFNNLQDEKDIEQYDSFLFIKGQKYTSKLLELMDNLGRVKAPGQSSNFGVERSFILMKGLLRPLRDPRPLHENDQVIEHIARRFNAWYGELPVESSQSIASFFKDITSCLKLLMTMITDFKNDSRLQKHVIKEEKATRANTQRFEERREFSKNMYEGKVAVVSKQRLRELYPEEDGYQKILKQCDKFGVDVFDAEDPDEKKTGPPGS